MEINEIIFIDANGEECAWLNPVDLYSSCSFWTLDVATEFMCADIEDAVEVKIKYRRSDNGWVDEFTATIPITNR